MGRNTDGKNLIGLVVHAGHHAQGKERNKTTAPIFQNDTLYYDGYTLVITKLSQLAMTASFEQYLFISSHLCGLGTGNFHYLFIIKRKEET